jgi:hypothetical protein
LLFCLIYVALEPKSSSFIGSYANCKILFEFLG